jgi:hypothetical protein
MRRLLVPQVSGHPEERNQDSKTTQMLTRMQKPLVRYSFFLFD